MKEQLTFPLTYRPAIGRCDFLIGECNQEAVQWIDKYPNWPEPALLILGESGCGKSHLASIFTQTQISARSLTLQKALAETALKVVVEDIDCLASEEALFCLYNKITERKGNILMTARRMPVFKLKDLRSRMSAIPKVYISMPDEELLGAVLMKIFYEKQLLIDPDVISFVLQRLPRSFEAAVQIAEIADSLSLKHKKKITIPLMKQALIQWEHQKQKEPLQFCFFK